MTTIILLLIVLLGGWYFWERSNRKTHAMAGGLHDEIILPHTQEWELYHNAFSLCSKKTRVCLAELGIDYKSHHIDLIETGAYENISRDFLKVNPASLVPTLVHNGHPIYESADQLVYAAEHSSDPLLAVPADAAKRKLMEHWIHKSSIVGDNPIEGMKESAGNAIPGLTLPIFSAMIEHIPYTKILEGLLFHRFKERPILFLMLKFRGVRSLPGIDRMVDVIKKSRAAMHDHLDELESALERSGGPWIVGEQFTLADVGMMVIFDRMREVDWLDEFLIDGRPRVNAYWDALKARPSYAAGIANHEHPTVVRGLAKIVELKGSDAAFRGALVGA
jgi:glutathione S-transferase